MRSLNPFVPLSLLLFVVTSHAGAQRPPVTNSILTKTNQIKFSLATVTDYVNSGLELSYEKQYARLFATQVGVTVMSRWLKDGLSRDFHINRFSGYRIILEQKFFPPVKKKRLPHPYFSLELMHLSVNTDMVLKNEGSSSEPRYLVHRRTSAATLKLGFEIPLRSFIIDVSTGTGLKHRIVESNYEYRGFADSFFPEVSEYKPFNDITINIPGNIRVGYLF